MNVEVLDHHFLGAEHAIASFLVQAPDGLILIESGPGSTRHYLLGQLAARGLAPEQIRHVLVTHIHLDHAGAAGWWAAQGATIYVHEQGAPHLIDPSKLLSSARRIYGDRFDMLWGETLPCPAERVVALSGGSLEVAGLRFEALDTPGHARHHLAFLSEGVLFTGDVAAVRLPGSGYVSVPAPPPEYDLEAWLSSLEKLRAAGAERFYLTHFGAVDDPVAHLDQLERRLREATEFIGERRQLPRDQVVEQYYAWSKANCDLPSHEFEIYEKANPLFMSVDGILRYWSKR